MPRGTRDALSLAVLPPKDEATNRTARGARVAGPNVPDMQGHGRQPCRTPSGREASRTHEARLRPGRRELLSSDAVWRELEARGATIATVPFSGRAGQGGRIDRVCCGFPVGLTSARAV